VKYKWKTGNDNGGIEVVSGKIAQFELLEVRKDSGAQSNSKGNGSFTSLYGMRIRRKQWWPSSPLFDSWSFCSRIFDMYEFVGSLRLASRVFLRVLKLSSLNKNQQASSNKLSYYA
jgi:hypothetical protein